MQRKRRKLPGEGGDTFATIHSSAYWHIQHHMTVSEAILGKEDRLNHRHTLQRGQDKVPLRHKDCAARGWTHEQKGGRGK